MTDTSTSAYDAPAAQTGSEAPLNVLGVVAFVLSVLGFNLVSVILGHIALSQIKRTGERGKGFAIAALVLGYAAVAVGLVLAAFVVMAAIFTSAASTVH